MRKRRGPRAGTFLAIVACALAACVAGPQPEPPNDPSDAGPAARDAARPRSDLGPSAPDAGASPPPMPPPPDEQDAGSGDVDDAGMVPMPGIDGGIAETDAASIDAAPDLDAETDGAIDLDAQSDVGVSDDAGDIDEADASADADPDPTDTGPTDSAPDDTSD